MQVLKVRQKPFYLFILKMKLILNLNIMITIKFGLNKISKFELFKNTKYITFI